MASRLDDLIREHAERLDQLAGSIDLTDVTSAPGNDITTVALVDEHTWTQSESRHRWPIIAIAAAAVVAVVVGGLMVATRTDDPTGEVPADQPTTVTPRRETGVFEGGPSVTYTVPDGWENTGYGVVKRNPMFGVVLVGADDNFYTSYCRTAGEIGPAVGPTVDDLVSAWANLPGVDATAATDVTIGGFDGRQIEFTVPEYKLGDCDGMFYRCAFGGEPRQPLRCESLLADHPTSDTTYQAQPGQRQKISILEVDGSRLMIVAWSFPNTSQQDRAALDEIVASIQIR